jgi:hypothetical protein
LDHPVRDLGQAPQLRRESGSGAASDDEHDADDDTLSRDAPQHIARHLPLLCQAAAVAVAACYLSPPTLLCSLLQPEKSGMADILTPALPFVRGGGVKILGGGGHAMSKACPSEEGSHEKDTRCGVYPSSEFAKTVEPVQPGGFQTGLLTASRFGLV